MIQLSLDGLQAALPEKTSIKFTSENPYFTKTSSYTYEIELPLSMAENRRIFGWINRLDIDKEERMMSARLIVDNRTLLVGTAHITSITDTSVKVQLLGSASSYNYGNKMADTHIDQLDLGDWLSSSFPDLYPDRKFTGTTIPLLTMLESDTGLRPGIGGGDQATSDIDIGYPMGSQPWVAFPVVNSAAGIKCNDYAFYEQTEGKRDFIMKLRSYSGTHGNAGRPNEDAPVDSFAVQPYVWLMAEKIAYATGFKLNREHNHLYSNTLFRRIFIANANNCIECCRCLPHWSVNEWWTEVENTFGVIMTVDYSDMTMRLIGRKEFYTDDNAESRIHIRAVLDEFSVDLDDDTQNEISVSNVGFADFENGREDLLSEFVMDNAVMNNSFNSLETLRNAVLAESGDRKNRYKKTLFCCDDGRQYIYALDCGADSSDCLEKADNDVISPDANGGRLEYATLTGQGEGLAEVNMFRPRMTDDSSDVDVNLRFVPARTVFVDADLYLKRSRHPGATVNPDVPVASFQVSAIERPDRPDMDWYRDQSGNEIDLEAVIADGANETADDSSAVDVIYIAIDNPQFDSIDVNVKIGNNELLKRKFSYPRAILRERTMGLINSGITIDDPGVSLSLIPIAGQMNIASETLGDGITVNTKSRYCIRFIYDKLPDVSKIFNIRNRLFVCEKIEADITIAGLGKLFTGYFYELTL